MGRRYRRRSKEEIDPVAAISFFLFLVGATAFGAVQRWWTDQTSAGQWFLVIVCGITALAGMGAVIALAIYVRRRRDAKIHRELRQNQAVLVQRGQNRARSERNALQLRQFMDVDPTAFERAVGTLFITQGYRVAHSGRTGDGGVDLELEKDGLRYIVQCKKFTNQPIGEPLLRDFYGTLTHRRVDHGFFVTTSRFTSQAKAFVQYKPITLVDKDELQRWLDRS